MQYFIPNLFRMKYFLVVVAAFLAINSSIQETDFEEDFVHGEAGNICVTRYDGSCRKVTKDEDIEFLNKQMKNSKRYWKKTSPSECASIYQRNQIAFCTSTCENVRRNHFGNLDCSGEKPACIANSKTNMCNLFRDECQAAAESCNGNEPELYIAQLFRCENAGLTKLGDKELYVYGQRPLCPVP